MYKLFLDLQHFLTACRQNDATATLQPLQKLRSQTVPSIEASIMLTAVIPTVSPSDAPFLLAARVVIEETQTWGDNGAETHALQERTAQGVALMRAACAAQGVAIAPQDGILAEPGLTADLWKINTNQDLWRIERPTPTHSAGWTLQPLSTPPANPVTDRDF